MHPTIHAKYRLTLLAQLLGAAFAAPALAQSPPPAATDDAPQVVMVTAQKRKEKLQDVPVAATALSARELEMRGLDNVANLGSIAPNLAVTHTPGNSTAAQISIRGSVTINPALFWEPTVGMYVDGVYSGKVQGAVMDLVDLERVEVLRGPQGTLYGRNTMAGAINFITRKPSGELGGSATLEVGNYRARVGKATLDLPRVGIFKATVGMRAERRDGWVTTTPGSSVPELNNRDGQSARIALDADASEDVQFSYRYDASRADQNGSFSQVVHSDLPVPGIVVTQGRTERASVDAPSLEKMDSDGHALSADWKLDAGNTLKATVATRALTWDDGLDLDGSPIPLAQAERHSTYRQRSAELQLTGQRGAWFYVMGLYAFRDDGFTNNPQSFFFGAANYDSQYGFTTDAKSAYAQLDYQITEQLRVSAGLRYTEEDKTISRFLAGPGVSVPFGTAGAATFRATTPLLSVGYKVNARVNVYAKYAEGFKSGGFNGEASDVVETLTPFRPEKLKSVEAGLKTTLAGGTTLNLALFNNLTTDLQESIFTAQGAAASNIRNAGKATTRGLELEFGTRPAQDLRLQASYGYLSAHYDEFIDRGVNVADNRAMVHAPRHSLNLLADATLSRNSYGTWRALADYVYSASHYSYPYQLRQTDPSSAVAGNSRIAAAGFLNLRLALSGIAVGGTRHEIAFWARNALDKEHVANYIDFGPGFGNLRQAYYAPPRTIGATLKSTF
ncbi:TonB-dependent receptor [Massilia cavernae]|uniref:TonB-dependent receptor n=1 Tax=Massilia cavernae TaxID=2320864 RepID=A0A418Y0Z5_9BURK|nr:TonB-dependent receptor [Massilia cavernae]RJG19021.1 TonB-dependent receptor [Massilia cavernae]